MLLLINIKYILSLGSSRIFNKALTELIFKSSILSISTNLGFELNDDLLGLKEDGTIKGKSEDLITLFKSVYTKKSN